MPKGYPKNGINSGRFVKGFSPWNKGRNNLPKHSEEQKKKISDTCKLQGCGQKKGYEFRGRFITPRGPGNPNWKGGITEKKRGIRFSADYQKWRKGVFKRDDYTCQLCGRRGYELNADHIKPFDLFPELVFEISNGRTLCGDCHRQTMTYGTRVKKFKREDFL